MTDLSLFSGPPCTTAPNARCRYLSSPPTSTQAEIMSTVCRELLHYGATAGGKTWGLLAGALQFADVPRYSALVLRRDLTDLTRPGGLIDAAVNLLTRHDATYNSNERKWTFPSGATLLLGHLGNCDHDLLWRRYGGDYQYIGINMAEEVPDDMPYRYLFSRLRRPRGMTPPEMASWFGQSPDGLTIADIPLRMRITAGSLVTLPGEEPLPGIEWVRQRFLDGTDNQPSLRSSYRDNPCIDTAEYEAMLRSLPEDVRLALTEGDWTVQQ